MAETTDKKKTILFTIEITDRELVSKCLLALEMAKRGFRVYIGSFRSIHTTRNKIKSCIFFHKSAYKRRVAQYKKSMGATVAILDEETGFSIQPERLQIVCQHRYGSITPKNYDFVFTIGEKYSDLISNMENTNGVKIISSGWPRIDLWREEFHNLFKEEIKKITEQHGHYTLFVSSFGFLKESGYNFFRKTYSSNELLIKTIDNTWAALSNYVDLIKRLSEEHKDRLFIIRPHTSESTEEWESLLPESSNIKIIRSGDITPWILAADNIITYRSTIAIQAALNGIPVIQYKINKIDGLDKIAGFKVSSCTETYDEVSNLIKKANTPENRDFLIRSAIRLLGDEISSLDGKRASTKIAETLSNIEIAEQPSIEYSTVEKWAHKLWKRYKHSEHLLIKKFRGRSSAFRPSRFDKIPNGINADEISSIIRKLCLCTGDSPEKIAFSQVTTDLVCIQISQNG